MNYPECTHPKQDCARRRNMRGRNGEVCGRCLCLTDTFFSNKDCPFYEQDKLAAAVHRVTYIKKICRMMQKDLSSASE